MLVGGLVDFVVAFGFEEEVAGLAGHHGDEPADECGGCRVLEDQSISEQETKCAQQMERLVDAAVVIVTMVVISLESKSLEKTSHSV